MKKFLAILTVALTALQAFAQSYPGGVTGKVVSRSGRVPVAKAELVVSNAGGQVAKTMSADDGTFLIENLPDSNLSRYIKLFKDKIEFRKMLSELYPEFFFKAVC